MKRRLYIVIFFLTVVQGLTAQWRTTQLYHFGPDDGLTSGVRDIDQDAQGYMYFATDQGMYRYDGNVFKYYGHDASDSTSISSGHVFDLHISLNQKIYLALYGPYLNVFDPATQVFEKFKYPEHNNFKRQFAQSLAEDANGNIWIGGENYQLFKFDPNTKKFTTYSVPWVEENDKNGSYTIWNIFPDPGNKNILWLTLRDERPLDIDFPTYGLVQFNLKTHSFTRVNGAGNIRLEDGKGHLWGNLWADFITEMDTVQHTTHIHSYKYFYEDHPTSRPDGPNVSFDIVRYQNKMLIANGDVLSFDNAQNFEFFYDYPKGIGSRKLFVDNAENLWIGLSTGVDVYSPKKDQITFYALDEFEEDKRIYPGRLVYESQDQSFYLVASTSNNLKQIYKIPLMKTGKAQPIKIQVPFIPQAIAQKNDRTLYINGEGKIYNLDLSTLDIKPDASFMVINGSLPFLYKLISNEKGWIVGLGHDRIIWWNDEVEKIEEMPIQELDESAENNFYTNLHFYGQDQIMITTRTNAFFLDLNTSAFQKFKIAAKDTFPSITGLAIDQNQNVWMSTLNQLTYFTINGNNLSKEKSYALKDGITSPTIQEIYIDRKGKVWIFHNSGIDCLNPKTDEIRSIGSQEGIPNTYMDPIQIVETEGGHLATNCGNGLIIWHPDSLWNALGAPAVPLVVQSLQVNGKNQEAEKNISGPLQYNLQKGPKVISVKYQGLAFPTDNNVRYSYRFVNRDSAWVSTGTLNQLILSDLPYGKNILEIKSGDPEAIAPSVVIHIFNPTPILASPWFYISLAIAVLTGILLLYKWRVKELKKKEEKTIFYNKKMAELELTALRSQMNPHFMFNSLNSIKTYILEAKPDIAADYLSQFSHLIRRILQHSREKRISLEDEIETLRLYIQLEQFRFERAFEYTIDIDPQIDLSEIMIPPTLLQPFVENAIWHGLMHKRQDGKLKLEFIQQNGYISCTIDDNGIGRKKAKELKSLSARKYKSMGMSITKNRVQLLNTIDSLGITLDIIDKYNSENNPTGTKVILTIPMTTDE